MRKLLVVSVAALPLLLGACNSTGTTTGAGTVNQVQAIGSSVAADIQTLSGGLPAIEAALQATGTLTASQSSQVGADVATAQAAANTLASEATIPATDTNLQAFEAAVNDALTIANVVAPGNPYVMAATVIAPLVGIVVNTVATQVQSGVAAAPAPTMTPAEARLLLKAAAAK